MIANSHRDVATAPPGLAAFDALRAEDEPWLASCYVSPAEFSLMAGARSALIFGEEGSGKSALRLALERAWQPSDPKSGWLQVEWPINALIGPVENLADSALAIRQQRQVFDTVARGLLRWSGQHPALWRSATDGKRLALVWFVQNFVIGDLSACAAALAEDVTIVDPTVVREIAAAEPANLLSSDASPRAVVAFLMEALGGLGIAGIRILVDHVEPWWESQSKPLTETLYSLLSTLELFEHPAFIYKMLLPAGLSPQLSRASGVIRRRVQMFHLRWSIPQLVAMLERRLAFAVGRTGFTLADLGPADALQNWLARCGAQSPRGWLETVQPFLAVYLSQQTPRPLTDAECLAIQQNHPPVVAIDSAGAVTVGWRRIEGLGAGHLALLRHLLDRPGQLCPRRRLYTAYIEAYPDGRAEPDARPAEYASVLDSALWRLRSLIEPVPETPVLLETKKGQGVLLRVV